AWTRSAGAGACAISNPERTSGEHSAAATKATRSFTKSTLANFRRSARTKIAAQKKNGGAGLRPAPPWSARTTLLDLEIQLQRELNDARVEGGCELTEVVVDLPSAVKRDAVGNLVELRVVEGVEGLEAELQTAATSLAEDEVLKQREVPVVAARA